MFRIWARVNNSNLVRGPDRRLSPESSFAIRVMGCFVFCTAAMVVAGPVEQNDSIWACNGLLLSYLLLSPKSRWIHYASAGLAAQVLGRYLVGDGTLLMNLAMAGLNLAEILLAAFLVRRRYAELPRFTDRSYLIRFVVLAVMGASAMVAAPFSVIAHFWIHQPVWKGFHEWFVTDALGYAVTTPAIVAIFRTRFRRTKPNLDLLCLLAVVPITVLAFHLVQLAAFSIIAPMLVIILLRFGMGWASMAALLVAVVASHDFSRLPAKLAFPGEGTPIIALQAFLVSVLITLYSVSVVMARKRAVEKNLSELATLHQLVTENSRDVIIIADFEGNRSYVSPAATTLSGWSQEELLQVNSLDFVHCDDREICETAIRSMAMGADGAVIELRAHKKDGNYVWAEASMRTIRNPVTRAPVGILNMVRDISKRKQAEESLQAAYRAMENMAVIDALTGLANRRRFDEYLETEWRRALRDGKPVSIVLMDVDMFKLYNDTYGHLSGDRCLKTIAAALAQVVMRPADLVARFGGEEFAVILPGTGAEGAKTVASDLFDAVRSRQLEHCESPFGIVTMSAGVATTIPHLGQQASELIEQADRALYRAKRRGRNNWSVAPDFTRQDVSGSAIKA